ncbi:MAG: hypothetical protein GX560_09445 [Deinococcales bacterium]|nr:hypothetical protein [Deinococcales bacterium]
MHDTHRHEAQARLPGGAAIWLFLGSLLAFMAAGLAFGARAVGGPLGVLMVVLALTGIAGAGASLALWHGAHARGVARPLPETDDDGS